MVLLAKSASVAGTPSLVRELTTLFVGCPPSVTLLALWTPLKFTTDGNRLSTSISPVSRGNSLFLISPSGSRISYPRELQIGERTREYDESSGFSMLYKTLASVKAVFGERDAETLPTEDATPRAIPVDWSTFLLLSLLFFDSFILVILPRRILHSNHFAIIHVCSVSCVVVIIITPAFACNRTAVSSCHRGGVTVGIDVP